MEAQFPPRLGKTTMLETPNSILELDIYENPGPKTGDCISSWQKPGAVAVCFAKDLMLSNKGLWKQEYH
jgi:hypothetical protein